MTKLYFILIFLILGLSSCSEDEIDTYDSFNYLSFVTNDTIEVSFLMLGKDEYDCPIEVRHTGLPSYAEYKDFKVKVVEENTTMSRSDFTIPPTFTFQPMSMLDTFYVKLTNYNSLETKSEYICLELEANENFLLGDRDYRRLYLKVDNQVSRPDWWTTSGSVNVTKYFLGTYSDEKYRLLIQVVQPDFSDTSVASIRLWALTFKEWLEKNPQKEADGSTMTVPIKL